MVFILEDDPTIAELVAYALKNQKIDSRIFEDAASLYNALNSEIPALLVLDIMLPDENGLSVIKKLRENHRTKNIAIIVLSALSSEYDKISGLDLGADDYLTKPFSALELIARIKALLRRSGKITENEIIFNNLKISKTSRSVEIDGEPINLTLKEFELLTLLAQNPNKVFSRDELMENIWGYNIANTRTIDIHINTLRTKLGALGSYIKTIRGVGYQFDKL